MKQFRQVLTHLFCIHIIALALMSLMRVVFFFSIKNGLTRRTRQTLWSRPCRC